MTRATSPTPTENEEEFVWPEYTPSPAQRRFIERLKRARIERGLSIPDMSDEVGLTFGLAYEFEDATTPLPFSHLSLWCQVVGVPFDDYLAIYWAEMAELEAQEREFQDDKERESEQKTPCITNTEAPDADAPAPALSHSSRGVGFLNLLRSIAAHIRHCFFSLFYTSKKTPK